MLLRVRTGIMCHCSQPRITRRSIATPHLSVIGYMLEKMKHKFSNIDHGLPYHKGTSPVMMAKSKYLMLLDIANIAMYCGKGRYVSRSRKHYGTEAQWGTEQAWVRESPRRKGGHSCLVGDESSHNAKGCTLYKHG